MREKIIGIDIDGTLNMPLDIIRSVVEGWFYDNGLSLSDRKVNYHLENIQNMFSLTDEEKTEINDIVFPMMVNTAKVMPNAASVVNILRKEYQIWIITARDENYGVKHHHNASYSGTEMMYDTKEWLAKNNIGYDNIQFGASDKYQFCKDHNVSVMIDDSPTNIVPFIHRNYPVIAMEHPYNKYMKDTYPDIPIFDNWTDIFYNIHNILR